MPFVVAARTTWLDPNGATDDTGVTPAGTSATLDPLGRTLISTDPLSHVTTISYGIGTSGVSGDSNTYATTTSIDTNSHVSENFADALGRIIYAIADSGTNGSTLTPNLRKTIQYNVLNAPASVTVTDLAPQTGQAVTSVTATTRYDDLGRVLSVNDPDKGTHTFTYDADGQVITDVSGARTIGTSYDLLGRVGCVQDAAPTADPHGACTSGAHPFVQNTYDADPSGVTWGSTSYAVGELTQSIATTSASTITVYAFGLEEHVYSYSGSGSTLSNTYYYSLGGRLIGTLSGSSTQSTSFMLTDTLGSVVTTISNTAGSAQLLGNQVYGPYGNKRSSAGTMGTAKGYTGQYNDDVTGLDYYNARYYDPVIGRFLSADSVQGNLSGVDPYDYVGGNPETDTDPTGHFMVIDGGVGNYYSNQYQKAQAAGVGSIWSTILGGSSGSGSHSAPKSAPKQASSPSHSSTASVTHFPWGAVKSSAQSQKKNTSSQNNNQNNALCPGGNAASDCFKWTMAAVHINHTQISMPTLGGMSVNIDVPTVSVSPFSTCVNPIACLEEGGDQSQGESESSDSYYFESAACSFTSQTTVATDQGKRPISKLHPGEQVWAYNTKTHKMEVHPILHVWIHQDDDLVDLTIIPVKENTHGETEQAKGEVVHTNKKHPFLTIEKGFLPVAQIKLGMHVLRADAV